LEEQGKGKNERKRKEGKTVFFFFLFFDPPLPPFLLSHTHLHLSNEINGTNGT